MSKINLPNKITLSRIFITPVVIFFYLANFIPFHILIATVLFLIGVTTDFIDGYIARKYNLVTNMGKFLDPIADKLINISAIVLIVADGTMPTPWGAIFAIVLMGRELVIGALRQIAASAGVVIAADKWGKLKTLVQDIALIALMLLAQTNELGWATGAGVLPILHTILMVTAFTLSAISVVLTLQSLLNYLVQNKQVIQ